MAYGITKSSQMIDYNTIKSGCEQMKNAAHDFFDCGNKVIEASSNCTEKVLSVDGATLQPKIEELGRAIESVEAKIVDYANQIENAAAQVKQAQQQELEEYKAEQKRIEKEKKEKEKANAKKEKKKK